MSGSEDNIDMTGIDGYCPICDTLGNVHDPDKHGVYPLRAEAITLTLDGNPGAAKRDNGEWEGMTATISIERFIYHRESATEAQLEVSVGGFDSEVTSTSVELTYDDLIALRETLNDIIASVVADGRSTITEETE